MKILKAKLILFGILLFHLINNFIWLKLDKSYLLCNSFWHHAHSLKIYNVLKYNLKFNFFIPGDIIFRTDVWHLPLVTWITAPFYFIFGPSQDAGVIISSTIFLPILIFSTYGIAKVLSNEKAGLLAAFIVTMYPIIFNHLRTYMFDFPLTAMVALSIYLLIRADEFKNKKYSIILGLALLAGLLVKINFGIFVLGPLLVFISKAILQKGQRLAKKNILFLLTIIIFTFLFIYIMKGKDAFTRIFYISTVAIVAIFTNIKDGILSLSDLVNWQISQQIQYFQLMLEGAISVFLSIIFFIGIYFFLRSKIKMKWILFLPIFMTLFYFIFLLGTYPPESIVRHSMPFLPLIAVITAIGLESIRSKLIKITFMSLIITIGIFQFFAISYGLKILPEEISIGKEPYKIVLLKQNMVVHPDLTKLRLSHPSQLYLNDKKILDEIVDLNDWQGRIMIAFLDPIPEVHEPIEYRILAENLPINIFITDMDIDKVYRHKWTLPFEKVLRTDYVYLLKSREHLWHPIVEDYTQKAKKIFLGIIDKFDLIKEINLPDGTPLLIYKNRTNWGIVEEKSLRLCLHNGIVKLYYQNIELTENEGLNIHFFYQGKTYNSTSAVWQIEKTGPTDLFAILSWPELPIKELWKIGFKNGNIYWQVDLVAEEKIELNDLCATVSLKKGYKSWLTLNASGFLPRPSYWGKCTNVELKDPTPLIGLNLTQTKDSFLPAVLFDFSQNQRLSRPSLQVPKIPYTQTIFYRLSVNGPEKMQFPSRGYYNLFSGQLFLFDKQSDITDYVGKKRKELSTLH